MTACSLLGVTGVALGFAAARGLLFFQPFLAVCSRLLVQRSAALCVFGLRLPLLLCTYLRVHRRDWGRLGLLGWGFHCGHRWHLGSALLLALFAGLQAALGTLLTLGLVQALLLLPQADQTLAGASAHGAQAVFNGKPLLALRLFVRLLLQYRASLAGNALALSLCAGTQLLGPHGNQGREQDQAADQQTWFLHVNPVSTTRRSNARNSLDCISLSRETVRGNSWASGPSV